MQEYIYRDVLSLSCPVGEVVVCSGNERYLSAFAKMGMIFLIIIDCKLKNEINQKKTILELDILITPTANRSFFAFFASV